MTVGQVSRRERKKDETRERITQAAIELFSDRGYEATTVDDIAGKADVAKGTFFNYFPRKEALLDALAEQKVSEMEEVTQDLLAQAISAGEKLSRFAAEVTARHARSRELSRMAVARILTHLHDPIHSVPASLRGFLRSLLEQGQANGEIRPDIDAGRAASIIQGAAIGTLFMWFSAPAGSFDLEQEMQERLSLILDGIATRVGGAR